MKTIKTIQLWGLWNRGKEDLRKISAFPLLIRFPAEKHFAILLVRQTLTVVQSCTGYENTDFYGSGGSSRNSSLLQDSKWVITSISSKAATQVSGWILEDTFRSNVYRAWTYNAASPCIFKALKAFSEETCSFWFVLYSDFILTELRAITTGQQVRELVHLPSPFDSITSLNLLPNYNNERESGWSLLFGCVEYLVLSIIFSSFRYYKSIFPFEKMRSTEKKTFEISF